MKKNLLKFGLKNIPDKKSLIVFFGIIFIFLTLFLNNGFNAVDNNPTLKNFYSNQVEKVSAAEEKPINCRKQTEVKLPIVPGITIDAKFGPNEFEVPIGKVIDMTESVAERTMAELQKIIDASILEAAAAGQMTDLSGQCGINRCTTPGCTTESYDCEPCLSFKTLTNGMPTAECEQWSQCSRCAPPPPCGGQACPNGINDQLQKITAQKNIISEKLDEIKGILSVKPNQPVGYWWLPGCHSEPRIPAVPGCLSEIDFILAELERARSGDYEILGGMERRPPGLEDCVIRPQDMEEVLKGEKTGKYLFSCREAVAAGVIESEDCYGYNEATEVLRQQAENYYCCE